MAKNKVMDRPMFKGMMPDEPVMDVENVGIMQGFKDIMADEGEEFDEDYETGAMMGRTPDSPEILMNNLRGDMRSIDARRDELADLVGTSAAMDTPDSVLAMLQPVLAQQGIGTLPPPPGAMPGAMPPPEMLGAMPPPGPMPGAMPPGPMPAAQGPMPPPPPGMPPGGIAGMPPPVQMAKGGIVQRFSKGSDEEGVTQDDDSSSSDGSFPADMVQTSRDYLYDYLGRQPAIVPPLSGLAQARAREYEAILGTDTKSTEAQMLLELAQRAFGYAANVDDQGRPLRGSPVARFAGAVRTLPGALAKYEGEMAKEGRAIKLAGIQGAEKERESIRESNAKLIESQRKTHSDIIKKAGGVDALFGKGAWEYKVINTPGLMARYAKRETDEDQTNLIDSAIAKLSQPKIETRTDPDTNLPYQVTVPGIVPGFVSEATRARKGGSIAPPVVTPRASTAGEGDSRATPRATTAPQPSVGAPVAVATPVQAPAGTSGTLPPSMRGPQPTIEAPGTPGAVPGRTLWSMSTNIAGPGSAIAGGISRIPGLGGSFPEVTQAQNLATQEVENLIEAFLKNARAPVAEQERLRQIYSIGPAFFTDPAAYRDRLIAIDEEITKEINLAKKESVDESLSSENRRNARSFLSEAGKFRDTLGIPIRIYTQEDRDNLKPGTPYLWKGITPGIRR